MLPNQKNIKYCDIVKKSHAIVRIPLSQNLIFFSKNLFCIFGRRKKRKALALAEQKDYNEIVKPIILKII